MQLDTKLPGFERTKSIRDDYTEEMAGNLVQNQF